MNNMNAIMQMLRSGGNPQQILTNMVREQSSHNPIMGSLMNMINTNNTSGIEALARNICKEKGVNPDEMVRILQMKLK